jgi:hypothetical protein
MAKISARGDRAWKRFRNDDGQELVYTEKGRLLLKLVKGGSFTLLGSKVAEVNATAEAVRRGMELV